MANVLKEEKKQQVIALGRLGWSLRRIQQETGIRRETASQYLKAAGLRCARRHAGGGVWQNRPKKSLPTPVQQNRPSRRSRSITSTPKTLLLDKRQLKKKQPQNRPTRYALWFRKQIGHLYIPAVQPSCQ